MLQVQHLVFATIVLMSTKTLIWISIGKGDNIKVFFAVSVLSPASQFSHRMLSFLHITTCVSKSQFSHRKWFLIGQVATVFAPGIVIAVAMTSFRLISTGIIHSTRTFSTTNFCPAPIIHLPALSRYPPSHLSVMAIPNRRAIAFIFYKLLTGCGFTNNGNNLLHAMIISNSPFVRSLVFIIFHISYGFAIMSNHCHTNTILRDHVTEYLNGRMRSTWTYIVVSTCGGRISLS